MKKLNAKDSWAVQYMFGLPYQRPNCEERFYYKTMHVTHDGTLVTTDGDWMRIMFNGADPSDQETDWYYSKGMLHKKESDEFWNFGQAHKRLLALQTIQILPSVSRELVPAALHKHDLLVPIDLLVHLEKGDYEVRYREEFVFLHQCDQITIFVANPLVF